MAAIRFLNTIAAGTRSALFGNESSLRQVSCLVSAGACPHSNGTVSSCRR